MRRMHLEPEVFPMTESIWETSDRRLRGLAAVGLQDASDSDSDSDSDLFSAPFALPSQQSPRLPVFVPETRRSHRPLLQGYDTNPQTGGLHGSAGYRDNVTAGHLPRPVPHTGRYDSNEDASENAPDHPIITFVISSLIVIGCTVAGWFATAWAWTKMGGSG